VTDILRAQGLTRAFGGLVALRDVDLTVGAGTVHAVIGPNGSGKTTLFNVVSGIYPPTAGKVEFLGRDAVGRRPEALADMGLGRTFQSSRLFMSMSVLETVLVVLHRRGFALRISSTARRRALEILDFVGLRDVARSPCASLPQGQRRLLEIAKVLALDPKLVLLDEPHGGLNHAETARLIDTIRDMRRQGSTILLIEHEMDVVMQLADEITVLNFGERLAHGTPAEIQSNEAVVEAYLGSAGETAVAPPRVQTDTGRLLDVRGLSVRFGDIEAVRGIDLHVAPGEIVSVLGNNGAGKSTTLKAISRLLPATGEVTFNGADLLHQPTEKLVGLGVALVPERRRLFGGMSVLDNLRVGAYGRPPAEVQEVMAEVLELFPSLKRLSGLLAASLSGGEQQMLAIGRALMSRPRLLMLDEPSLGLAPMLVDQVFAKLADINARGTAVLLVEQNARMALAVSHRAYVLASGRVVAEGDAKTLAADEGVKNAYLGIAAEADARAVPISVMH
jgi:ABC-type branched-subunit amino acid transport system ATPase component